MSNLGNEEDSCIICDEGVKQDDQLNEIGSRWTLKDEDDKNKKHPMDVIIEQAEKLQMENLVAVLVRNKQSKVKTFIHKSCRTTLRNNSRKRLSSSTGQEPSKQKRTRSEYGEFDFKTQCFYCGNLCISDSKHPDRKNFEEVRTKHTKIHNATLEICKNRDDLVAKTIESRLLNVNDLVAVEARYHVSCRTNFENPLPKFEKKGRPISTQKFAVFEKACEKLEDDIELYTVDEFHNLMSKLSNDIYSQKMAQIKLKERYGDSMRLVTRDGKSNIILLDRVNDILSEKWYQEQRKENLNDESKRIVNTAAKLLRKSIRNFDHSTNTYPSTDDIRNTENHVPELLKHFVNEMIRSPVKQNSIAQTIFSATRPRSLMPLQFALAVAADNRIASKWLNIVLSKLGFAASYDEVHIFL